MAGSRAPVRSWTVALLWFINPLLRGPEWDMAEFAAASDFIRPILYHVPEGPRIARYLGLIGASAGRGVPRDALWQVMAASLGLDLPALASVEGGGIAGKLCRPRYRIGARRLRQRDADPGGNWHRCV